MKTDLKIEHWDPITGYPSDDPSRVILHADRLDEPLRWRKPRQVLVNPMGDLFHKGVPFKLIDKVFAIMALASEHQFMIVTKQTDRMKEYFTLDMDKPLNQCSEARVGALAMSIASERGEDINAPNWDIWWTWPLLNIWLGVSSVEDVPILLQTPAAKRFVSIEPCLGAVDLSKWLRPIPDCIAVDPDDGTCGDRQNTTPECNIGVGCPRTDEWGGLDLVIMRGGSEPMHPEWVRSVRDQCAAAEVPFVFEGWGEWLPGEEYRLRFVGNREGYEHRWLDALCKEGAYRVGEKIAGRRLDGQLHDG